MRQRHVPESDLALYVSSDLGFWRGIRVHLHVDRCEKCRRIAEAYRHQRVQIREVTDGLPEGLDWSRLAAEMTANIRVGLAAGECVAPRHRNPVTLAWRPAAAVAGVAILVTGAWWLNLPTAQTQELGRAIHAIWSGRSGAGVRRGVMEERGPVVEATSSGIELRENGSSLGVSQGAARPLAVSVSVQGSASARYVDSDTGQMTITSVYAQ
jgi:hypothetical protein